MSSQLAASSNAEWMLGVSLDNPGNFWSLTPCPEDWLRASDPRLDQPTNLVQPLAASVHSEADDLHTRTSSLTRSPKAGPDLTKSRVTDPNVGWKVEDQVPARTGEVTVPAKDLASSGNDVLDLPGPKQPAGRYGLIPNREQLGSLVAELIQPLRSELNLLREKATETERQRSEFEAAQAQIPSDVEERLWSRVRQYVEADITKQTGLLRARSDEMMRRLETVRPHDEEIIASLRNLSTRIEAVDADLRTLVGEQTKAAQQEVGNLEAKIESVAQIASRTSEQLAGVPPLIRAQIAHQQDQLSTVTRKYAAEIEALKQFRTATDTALQQMTQMRTGLSNLCDEVSQGVRKQLAAFREDIESQIRQRSDETLTAAKSFFEEQGGNRLDATSAAAILQEIEAVGEALKARLQKTATDAQQHTCAIFEQQITGVHDEVRKWISDELQAFDHRAQILSEDLAARMRQEIGEAVIQDREALRAWLEEQKQDIRKAANGAALQATAEIKAKHHMNLEMAANSGQNLQQDMVRQLQERAGSATKEFEEQIAESINSFGRKLDELIQESVTRCRLTVVEDLKSIAITLDTQVRPKPQ